jgi:polyisoprenoid-binding protein YceI
MRARKKWLIAVITVVAVGAAALLAGPPLYARWANSKSEAPPELADSKSSAKPFHVGEIDGAWAASGGSSFAGYRVREILRGDHVTVTGRTPKVKGSMRVDGGRLRSAKFTVDVASIKTPEAARDAYFRGSTMNTDRFPKAGFVLTRPAAVRALADGRPHTVPLRGDLTLHGVRHAVSFTAHVQAAPHRAKIIGSIPVTFKDYGVEAPSLGFVKVEKHGSVEFSLSASPS